jgi:hypothetical protein
MSIQAATLEERDLWRGEGVEQPGDGAGCDVAAGLDGGQQSERGTAQPFGAEIDLGGYRSGGIGRS